jgi:hypothetical protein
MNGRVRRGWIAGVVVGVAGGLLALEIPTLGWLILVLFAVPAAIVGPRAAAIGGLVTGFGACWLVLLGRVAITCGATDDELGCHAPGIEQWLAVSAGVLAIGLTLTAVSYVRARPRAERP